MIFWLFVLGIIVLIVYVSSRGKSSSNNLGVEQQLDMRNKQWIDFIAGYGRISQNLKERALIQRMLDDIATQGLGEQVILEPTKAQKQQRTAVVEAAVAELETESTPQLADLTPQSSVDSDDEYVPTRSTPDIALDNVSLLLYFGAFLFVASVGLFISFGSASGELRTLAVFLVSIVLYSGGIWLYHNRPKLEQAAMAFVGIGVVIAPLIGAAAYIYVFDKSNGAAIWFGTSLLCLTMYLHALYTIRKPLIGYLLVFTFLSVFESGVSIMTVPVYYYGWGLALVGILLQLLAKWKVVWPELQEPSRQSAQIFLPIAIIASAVMTPANGALQLGVSLLLAALFYGLEFINARDYGARQNNAIVSQLSANAAVAAFVYGLHSSWEQVAWALLGVAVIETIATFVIRREGEIVENFASIIVVTLVGSLVSALFTPATLLVVMVGILAISTLLYIRQKRAEFYGLATIVFAALPIVYGQYYLTTHLTYTLQAVVALVVSGILLGLYIAMISRQRSNHALGSAADVSLIASITAAIVLACLASPIICLISTLVTATYLIVLAEFDNEYDWADAAAFVLLISLFRSFGDHGAFLVATLVTLAASIIMSLRYRRELMRWVSTFVWLAVPVAIGRAWPSHPWIDSQYAWAYLGAMAGLIFSRSIARGVLFVSSKSPLTSYARSASLSYVVGYIIAAIVAVGLSLATENSRVQTSIILGTLIITTWFLSIYVEKRKDILAIIPILLQGLLLSIIRPPLDGNLFNIWLVASTVLASICFWASDALAQTKAYKDLKYTTQIALITTFITPTSMFATGKVVWPVALGLFVAGLMTLYYVRYKEQTIRELAGSLITISVMMFMYIMGIHELQAYVHVVVATFGLYAYWRSQIGDEQGTDTYLWLALFTATIPLGLQALSGAGGGIYGWLLLIEQVVIMLLGMALNKSFVTRWGLFVAIGAVLYQLRNLGYVALGVLAIVLIGIAIYQLQKHDDSK